MRVLYTESIQQGAYYIYRTTGLRSHCQLTAWLNPESRAHGQDIANDDTEKRQPPRQPPRLKQTKLSLLAERLPHPQLKNVLLVFSGIASCIPLDLNIIKLLSDTDLQKGMLMQWVID